MSTNSNNTTLASRNTNRRVIDSSSDSDSESSSESDNPNQTKNKENIKKRKISNDNENINTNEPPLKRQKISNKKAPKKHKKKNKKIIKKKYKPVKNVSISDLNCCVCLDLPTSYIFQCLNGHLLCHECFGHIKESKSCICPICRIKLNRAQPTRNRFAEQYLESTKFECENDGCCEKIQYKYLKEHKLNECKYRIVNCKYSLIGCNWKGKQCQLKKHKKECDIKKMNVKQILKKVEIIENKKKKKYLMEKEINEEYKKFYNLFNQRCRNIEINDITLIKYNNNNNNNNNDNNNENILKSNKFRSIHNTFEVELKKIINKDNEIYAKIKLNLVSHIQQRLLLNVSIFNGCEFEYKLVKPCIFEFEFKKDKKESNWYEFKMNKNDINNMFNNYENINLRIVLIDKRSGNISTRFRRELLFDDRSTIDSLTYSSNDDNNYSTNSNDQDNSDENDSNNDSGSLSYYSNSEMDHFDETSDW